MIHDQRVDIPYQGSWSTKIRLQAKIDNFAFKNSNIIVGEVFFLLPLRQSLPAPSSRFPQLSLKISGVVDDSFMCRGVYPDMFLLFYTQ